MPTHAPVLRLTEISKAYRQIRAVAGVSLELKRGEIFGLLGPNGAGKTTALRMVVGLSEPDSGRVELCGIGNPRKAQVRKRIGYAPQSLCVYDELSGRENLELMAGLYGLAGNALRERVEWALAFVSLSERAAQRAGTYSVGMKRRLTLATAIVHDPALLVLDEPTAGVDPQSRNAIFENLRALRARGTSVLYTTHFMEEAELLCDRVAILDHGRLLTVGSVAELTAVPTLAREPEARGYALPGQRLSALEALFLELTGQELRDT